jgi:hypothetical protein
MSKRKTQNSGAVIFKFPKAAKPKPQPQAQNGPWWVDEANYILTQARQYPQVDCLIHDRTRAFIHIAARWPNPPNEKQTAWLLGIADMVEERVESLKALEADKTPPTSPGAA